MRLKIFLNLLLMVISMPIFAENSLSPQPLTLSDAQVLKLKALFPQSIREVEGAETSETPLHLIWRQIPLNIILPIHKERIITFPGKVELGVNREALPDNVLHIENDNGTVYLTARAPFAPERIAVKLQNQSTIILLNVSASEHGDTAPINIVLSSTSQMTPVVSNSMPATHAEIKDNLPDISYVDLNRFAIQELYAPKRLLHTMPGVYRTPMHANTSEPLVRDGSVIASPLASWRGGDYYVTVVLLKNQMDYPLRLQPTSLCGDWITAAFFRNPRNTKDNPEKLTKGGTLLDSTTVFLTSSVPFENALSLCK